MKAQFDHASQEKNNKKRSTENAGISMPSTILVHAKLEMTSSGDSEEREADEMAESVVNDGKIARAVSTGHSGSGIALPSQFGSQLASLQGHGSQLYGDLKNQMESGFGRDFSSVRLHTDDAAAEMSSSISAKAFTYGNDVYFGQGQFTPDTKKGQHLIAHELAHVAQGLSRIARENLEDLESDSEVETNSTSPSGSSQESNSNLAPDSSDATNQVESVPDFNQLVKDAAIEEAGKNGLAYAKQYDKKTKAGIGPYRGGKSYFGKDGDKCNIFVVNMLYDAYQRAYPEKDAESIKKSFNEWGLLRKNSKKQIIASNTVSVIYEKAIMAQNSVFTKIDNIKNVKAGDIVIWTYKRLSGSIQKPHHIETVTKDMQEPKGEIYDLTSTGAHADGAAETTRSIIAKEEEFDFAKIRFSSTDSKKLNNPTMKGEGSRYSVKVNVDGKSTRVNPYIKTDYWDTTAKPGGPIEFYRFNPPQDTE